MGRNERSESDRPIDAYEHRDKQRVNNPPVGLVSQATDPEAGQHRKTYAYDPHLAPELIWAGKGEHTSFEVPTVCLHVHERIEPRTIIEAVRRRGEGGASAVQLSLFAAQRDEPLREAIEFYRHAHGWSNRLIAGDSLLVMNSLLEKEGLAGKVQMVYIDPPYGIRYGSNFQPFVTKRDVKDGNDEDLTAEPEQILAFRDTWELGSHSYLTHLRDRLLLARELLTESGSIFVQISEENVHHVRELTDEVFGADNLVRQISFRKSSALGFGELPRVHDILVWYAKNKQLLKYRQLYAAKHLDESWFAFTELPNGQVRAVRALSPELCRSQQTRRLAFRDLNSSGYTESCSYDFLFSGRIVAPQRKSWRTHKKGMQRLVSAGRLYDTGGIPRYKQYYDDFPMQKIDNLWNDTSAVANLIFVVQTSEKVLERCLHMTTDPGRPVFDPTCGSGTTAYVAEQWGRRWITCDTSRVAITLARQRLMTAVFDYYELAHPEEGVGSGFVYRTVPHVTLKSIANNAEIDGIYARMHPAVEQALRQLNAALKGKTVPFRVATGGRAGLVVDFAAPDYETISMPSGQAVSVNALLEWEVPFEFPADWPEEAREPFERFHEARHKMQKAMDDAIARHAGQETLYDQPFVDRKRVRVTGPFTVEAVPAPVVKSVQDLVPPPTGRGRGSDGADLSVARSGETLRQAEWRDELLKTGIRGKGGQYIRSSRLEPLAGCRWLHADGETRPSPEGADSVREEAPAYDALRVVVSFGPEHALLEQRQVEQAIQEAQTLVPRPKLVVFAAFQFDPEAAKDIDETNCPGVTLLKVQMSADLLTNDLRKKRASNESFWLIGQPDVELRQSEDGYFVVEVHGFDYYNTKTGGVESGGKDKIALWLLDTDYDGRSLFPRQVFFPMAGQNEGWAKLACALKAEIDEDLIEAYRGTVSLPFAAGNHRRIAVKIVDDRGIESLKVMEL